jgi:hypothetical protein
MNSTFQPDSHPDAESLSAFTEQALPERERGLVLAHLAACSRCRQVVFLAREAASEFEMQEAAASRLELDRAAAYEFAAVMAVAPEPMAAAGAASGRMAGKRPGWWPGDWRLAWVPAAALAATIGLVVFVHGRHTRLGSETDAESRLVVPQSPSQTQPKPAQPPSADKAAIEKAQPAAPPIAAKVSTEKVRAASASAPSEALSAQAAPPAQVPAAAGAMDMSTTELNRARSIPEAPGQGAGMQSNAALVPQATPASVAPRPEVSVGGNSFNETSAGRPSTTVHGAAGRVQSSRSVSASVLAPQSAMKPAAIGSFAVSSQQLPESKVAVVAAHKAKITLLPSGLRAVSIATAQHRTLAIDSSGTVFLSEDSGSKWEPVATQWRGRAVAVRIQDGLKTDRVVKAEVNVAGAEDESKRSNPDSAVAPPAPPAVFEIVNDSDLVWVSADGKTWKAK